MSNYENQAEQTVILFDIGETSNEISSIIYKIKNMKGEIKKMEIGKKVIVTGDKSGVFFGTLANKEGREVELKKCRRLWCWDGAASISQLAVDGTKKPSNCKFTIAVEDIVILDAIEIIPCTDKATKCIESVKEWRYE